MCETAGKNETLGGVRTSALRLATVVQKPAGSRGLEAQVSVDPVVYNAGRRCLGNGNPALTPISKADTCASKPLLPAGFCFRGAGAGRDPNAAT